MRKKKRKTSATWLTVWAFIFLILIVLFFLWSTKHSPLETKEEPAPERTIQQESVTFPELGVVKITAEATDIDLQLPKLVIRDANKKVLFRL